MKKIVAKKHDSRRKNTVDLKTGAIACLSLRDNKTRGTKWVKIDILNGYDRCLSYIINVNFDNLSTIILLKRYSIMVTVF